MAEKRYIISDASKIINVEAHVLRYWEEELEIEIPRNEMGHRYYTDYYIQLFSRIKELKENGIQLKAIKLVLPSLTEGQMSVEEMAFVVQPENKVQQDAATTGLDNREKKLNEKMAAFQNLLGSVVNTALENNNEKIGFMFSNENEKTCNRLIKEVDYMMRLKDEEDELRYKKIDELLRNRQEMSVNNVEKRSKLWSKKRKTMKK